MFCVSALVRAATPCWREKLVPGHKNLGRNYESESATEEYSTETETTNTARV